MPTRRSWRIEMGACRDSFYRLRRCEMISRKLAEAGWGTATNSHLSHRLDAS